MFSKYFDDGNTNQNISNSFLSLNTKKTEKGSKMPSARKISAYLKLFNSKHMPSRINLANKINMLLLFSHSVMTDSLQPHGLQHTRLLCPPLSPGVCLNSCPLSQWYHPTISSSVTLFSCLQSFPASGSFPVSGLFTSGDQSIRASASATALPMNIQGWFPFGLTGLISLLSRGLSRAFSSTTIRKHQFFGAVLSLWSNSHISTWLLEKTQLWRYGPLSAKWHLCILIHGLGLS